MTWQQSLGPSTCGACRGTIRVGDAVLLVTSCHLRRCVNCAKRGFDAVPPTTWPTPEPSYVTPKREQAWATPKGFAATARAEFDAKLAQLPEDAR